MSEKIESEEMEAMLGKRVRITFEDWDEREGILGKPNFLRGYSLDMTQGRIVFKQSHVRKVEVIS